MHTASGDVITFHWVLEHWKFIVFILGSIIGGIVWWMRVTFASKAHMENCRVGMAESCDSKLDRYHSENKVELKELRTDINSILSHLLDRD